MLLKTKLQQLNLKYYDFFKSLQFLFKVTLLNTKKSINNFLKLKILNNPVFYFFNNISINGVF
jgi:hypothetical protein